MKRAFKTKQKALFITFKGLSTKQITQFFLEGESPTLKCLSFELNGITKYVLSFRLHQNLKIYLLKLFNYSQ